MKNYSSSRAQRGTGKVAYRTPSRWKAGQPERTKREKQSLIRWKEKTYPQIGNRSI